MSEHDDAVFEVNAGPGEKKAVLNTDKLSALSGDIDDEFAVAQSPLQKLFGGFRKKPSFDDDDEPVGAPDDADDLEPRPSLAARLAAAFGRKEKFIDDDIDDLPEPKAAKADIDDDFDEFAIKQSPLQKLFGGFRKKPDFDDL